MRILFPLNSFYPTTMGGPGTILYWHSVYLKKYGSDPVIITTTNGIHEKVVTNKLIELPCGQVYYNDRGIINMGALKVLFSEITKADVIHLTSLFSPSSIIAFTMAMLFNRKSRIVWSVRGELNSQALSISSFKKKILLQFYKLLAKQITFASTSAKETSEIKSQFPQSSVIELPNVMPTPTRIQKTETQKRFLYLGRIHPIKNLEALIEGFYNSKAPANPDVFLDIAGEHDSRDANYFQKLEDLVKKYNMQDQVIFLGHIAGSDKEKLLANAYFLVLPSHTENFGNVVIESLNQGTPVIASNHTPWAKLEESKCGLWVPNSPESIAANINYVLSFTPQEYEHYRMNALNLVAEQYNIDSGIQKWLREYEKLLN